MGSVGRAGDGHQVCPVGEAVEGGGGEEGVVDEGLGPLAVVAVGGEEDGAAFETAEASYLRAAQLEPGNPEPHESLGRLYDAIFDEPERAAESFRKAIALGAGPSAHEGLAEALEQLEER